MPAESSNSEGQTLTPSLSVVIPAYNEASRLESTLNAVNDYLSKQNYDWDVLVVDDGSTDKTYSIASKFSRSHPGFSVDTIAHAGKAAAVVHGMLAASGDQVLFMDADLATDLSHLDELRQKLSNGADMAIGSREGDGAARIGEPAHRHLMGRGFNGLVQLLLLPGIEDTQCGFKLFSRSSIDRLRPWLQKFVKEDQPIHGARVTAFDVELLVAARRQAMNIETVPVQWTYGEQSKVSPVWDTLHNLNDVLRVKINDLRGGYS